MPKTILITGAGSGIGKDTAFALARRGHRIIATTQTEEQAASLKEESGGTGLNIEVFKLDITSNKDRQKVTAYDLDVLINNAGIGESGSMAEIDIDKVRKNFEVNVFSSFEITQLALKKMMVSNRGTIIFISSLLGRLTMPFLGPYSMTKFAVSSGAETLRNEIRRVRKNVHVALIEPGAYQTGFNQYNISKKFAWMNEDSYFYPILEKLREEEKKRFHLIESRTTGSIVRKIVQASEAGKPRLRYSAPWWQAWGVQALRILGK